MQLYIYILNVLFYQIAIGHYADTKHKYEWGKGGEGGAPIDQSALEAKVKVGANLFSARKGFSYGDLNAFGGQKSRAYFLVKNKKLWNFLKKNIPADCYKESEYSF